MGFLNLCAYAMTSEDPSTELIEIILTSILIIFTFWVLFKFNRGYNWARVLVLITSVATLLNLLILKEYSLMIQGLLVFEAALGIFLLYWLNTERVKEYFSDYRESGVE